MYRALGTSYTIETNVPLLGSVTADIPIAAMTTEVIETAKTRLLWSVFAMGALGGLLGGAIVALGRKG